MATAGYRPAFTSPVGGFGCGFGLTFGGQAHRPLRAPTSPHPALFLAHKCFTRGADVESATHWVWRPPAQRLTASFAPGLQGIELVLVGTEAREACGRRRHGLFRGPASRIGALSGCRFCSRNPSSKVQRDLLQVLHDLEIFPARASRLHNPVASGVFHSSQASFILK